MFRTNEYENLLSNRLQRGSLLVAWAFNDSDDLNDEHDTSGQRGVHFINFQPPTV